jgi:hypothetical protein
MTPSCYAGLGETRRNLFRLLLIGYFEGIDSERGIALRVPKILTMSFPEILTTCR